VTPLEGITARGEAEHSSMLRLNNPPRASPSARWRRIDCYIIQMEGFQDLAMGDTGLFPRHAFIYEHYNPDLVRCRSAHLDMDPATRPLRCAPCKAKNVIPCTTREPDRYASRRTSSNAMKGSSSKVTV